MVAGKTNRDTPSQSLHFKTHLFSDLVLDAIEWVVVHACMSVVFPLVGWANRSFVHSHIGILPCLGVSSIVAAKFDCDNTCQKKKK